MSNPLDKGFSRRSFFCGAVASVGASVLARAQANLQQAEGSAAIAARDNADIQTTPQPDRDLYTCYRTSEAITIDGVMADNAWHRAPRSPRFGDIITGDPGHFDTRAAALWDDQNLYVSFWIEEPFPEAHLTRRDSIIFQENDVEVFIDGGDTYYEFEINALGTIYEVFYIWQDSYHKWPFASQPELDVLHHPAYSFGGNYDRSGSDFWRGKHPRGLRWVFPEWDFPGIRSAVTIDGKLNDRATVSRGWSVEIAFPWAGMKWLGLGRSLPPKSGDVWRIFFGRYEKLRFGGGGGGGTIASPAWTWYPIGDGDNHVPEKWTPIRFSDRVVQDL